MFLAAPVTWIEWAHPWDLKSRVGFLLDRSYDSELITAVTATANEASEAFSFGRKDAFGEVIIHGPADEHATNDELAGVGLWIGMLIPLLAMINSPKIIGRQQHTPHVGLQRALARSRGLVGRFELQPWTEIKLHVTPPDVTEHEAKEVRLTGAKALHFCRSFLRVRLGRLELVSAHWRGDKTLGIKRSRYVVQP